MRAPTPIAEVRGLGSARTGTRDFVVQRVTSVALAILLTAFLILLVRLNGEPHPVVVETLSSPLVAILLIASILVAIVHMRLGMQVIIEDYVHTELWKFALLIANWLFAWAVGLIAVFAVLKLAFGG
jgi:succinate dehydrogenase / fumarate reductase membrane anchor subunit